jgi:methyl-accepting chemotaxis protein
MMTKLSVPSVRCRTYARQLSHARVDSHPLQIQSSTDQVFLNMNQSVERANAGLRLSEAAGATITHLPTSANEVLVAVREISHALLEQSQASSDIARHVEKIAQLAQENSGAVDQTKESAQSLRCLAGTLQTSVMRFAV